jgi:hypothetical protein
VAATQSFGNLAVSAVVGAIWTLASPTAALIVPAVAMLGALAAMARASRG